MGFINTALAWLGFAKRDLTTENFFTGGDSHAFEVTHDQALKLMPVYSAVNMIASSWAMLTPSLLREVGDEQIKVAMPDWLKRPDTRITWFDWVFQCAASLLLRGNAYGYIMRGSFGQILGVRWIHPRHVRVDERGVFPSYWIGGEEHSSWDIEGDILHIRAFVLPGSVVGLSPVGLFRTQFETARSAVEYGHDWFDNPVPAGILKNDKATLTQAQMDEAKTRFKSAVKRGEPVALDMNWSWDQLSLNPADAQFLLQLEASANSIASIFGVDPDDIGGKAGNSLKYATVEGNQRKFNIRTLSPWVIRFEQAIAALLPADHALDLDMDATARPGLLESARVDSEQLKNGSITLPEVRAKHGKRNLTPDEIAFWEDHYLTSKSESVSESLAALAPQPPE